jgi:formyltetrahydrofolate hydrolase
VQLGGLRISDVNADNIQYCMDQTMYDKFRQQWFNFIDKQHELSDKLQELDDNGDVIRLNYLYEFGPRCQFNEQFHSLWSNYFNNHPTLSKKKSKIILTTKHLHSLNALLARQKSSYLFQQ